MKLLLLGVAFFISISVSAQLNTESQFRINQFRVCTNWIRNPTDGTYSCFSYPTAIVRTPLVSDLDEIIVALKDKITLLEERISKLEAK